MNLAVLLSNYRGIFVSLSLVYPLYGYLPGLYGVSLMPARIDIAVGFIILAGLLVVLTGWLAGRRSGQPSWWGTAKAGGVAGFVAAMIAFETIIASSAGIMGNKGILLHGLIPEPDEMKYIALVYHAVSGTIKWYAIGLWGSVLCGLIFGGFGGALAKSRSSNDGDWPGVFPIVSPLMFLFSAMIYYVVYASASLLMEITVKVGIKSNTLGPDNDPRIYFFLIFLAPFLWMVFWQIRLWRI